VFEADDGQRFVLKIAHAGEQWETLDIFHLQTDARC
jgi:hypothetical protein